MPITPRKYLIPLIVVACFFLVTIIPVEWIGCRNRGLLAVAIALLAEVAAIVIITRALILRFRHKKNDIPSIIAGLVLTVPALYIIWMA